MNKYKIEVQYSNYKITYSEKTDNTIDAIKNILNKIPIKKENEIVCITVFNKL